MGKNLPLLFQDSDLSGLPTANPGGGLPWLNDGFLGVGDFTFPSIDNAAVVAALGYTPANKAGETFTGDIAVHKSSAAASIGVQENLSGRYLAMTADATNSYIQGIGPLEFRLATSFKSDVWHKSLADNFERFFFSNSGATYLKSPADIYIRGVDDVDRFRFNAMTGEAVFGVPTGSNCYILGNTINAQYGTNGTGTLWLNYYGYLGAGSQPRDTIIGNGAGSALVTVNGSTGAATFAGIVTVGVSGMQVALGGNGIRGAGGMFIYWPTTAKFQILSNAASEVFAIDNAGAATFAGTVLVNGGSLDLNGTGNPAYGAKFTHNGNGFNILSGGSLFQFFSDAFLPAGAGTLNVGSTLYDRPFGEMYSRKFTAKPALDNDLIWQGKNAAGTVMSGITGAGVITGITISAQSNSTGTAGLQSGDLTYSGYVYWNRPGSGRQGYMGYDSVDGITLTMEKGSFTIAGNTSIYYDKTLKITSGSLGTAPRAIQLQTYQNSAGGSLIDFTGVQAGGGEWSYAQIVGRKMTGNVGYVDGDLSFNTALNSVMSEVLRLKANKSAVFADNLTWRPAAAVTPANNTELTFEATSDTSLTIKRKGSDGVVRSVVLTLAP